MNRNQIVRLFFFILCYGMILASAETAAQEKETDSFLVLNQTLEETLKSEKQSVEQIKSQETLADQTNNDVSAELNTYKIHETAYSNQLLNPEIKIKTLEDSYLDITESLRVITARYNDLKQKQEEIKKLNTQAQELIAVSEKQVQDIKRDAGDSPDVKQVVEKFKILQETLTQKKDLLKSIYDIYSPLVAGLNEMQLRYSVQVKKFADTIEKRKKQDLLERKRILESVGFRKVIADIQELSNELKNVFTIEYWGRQFSFVEASGEVFLGSFFLVLIIVLILAFRLRTNLLKFLDQPVLSEKYWTQNVLLLLKRSLLLLVTALFFYAILQVKRFQPKPMVLEAGANLLLVWVFTKWFEDFLKIPKPDGKPFFEGRETFYIRTQLYLIRIFAVFYIVVSWIYSSASAVIILGRLLFAVLLYIVNAVFWKRLTAMRDNEKTESTKDGKGELEKFFAVVKPLTYFIIVAGLVLDVTGYGLLAQLWFTSWGRSVVIVLWGGLLFRSIREWNPSLKKTQESSDGDVSHTKDSLQWVGVQFMTIAWFATLLVLFVLAWGGKQAVLKGIFQIIKMPVTVGAMQFSLLSLIVAVSIILITQGVARIWRNVFFNNLLSQSGMEEGVKESITTISVYVIWAIGIMIALNAFGFDSTSLTVALGALGIGIGFGLQNIFNNFLSGIILLFERPIQVGDDIEVNGIWATVKKINVRSTIVQTYDNASLIIPNSDLISSQVTNWSFKDKRLRRNIELGVAYGSDIELVRKTLLEVAASVPRVLRLPKPDVVFKDFGDNALIFRLRIWTRVEYFYAVETEIRFAIDRLFNERGIVIAFPQRDIHIKNDKIVLTVEEYKKLQTKEDEPSENRQEIKPE